MKQVMAVIRPEKLQAVQDALDAVGASGLTVTEALGCGKQRGYKQGTEFLSHDGLPDRSPMVLAPVRSKMLAKWVHGSVPGSGASILSTLAARSVGLFSERETL